MAEESEARIQAWLTDFEDGTLYAGLQRRVEIIGHSNRLDHLARVCQTFDRVSRSSQTRL